MMLQSGQDESRRSGLRAKLLWSLLLLSAVAVGGIAIVDPELPRAQLDRARETIGPMLAASSGRAIVEPIRISSEPDVTIVSGRILGASALETLVSTARASTETPSEIVIAEPVVVVRPSKSAQDAATSGQSLASVMADRRIGTVKIEGGTLRLVGAVGRDIELQGIDAEVDLKGRSEVAQLTGRLSLLGQALDFELSLDARDYGGESRNRAYSLKLMGQGIDGALEGNFGYVDGLQQSGVVSLRIADLAGLLERLGIATARTLEIAEVHAQGGMTLSDGVISLSATSIGTPQSGASGSLSIRLDRDRPVLDGTFDFQTLDLSRLGSLFDAAHEKPGAESRSSLPFATAIGELDDVDADLRLSAERVVAGKLEAGPLAATLTLRKDSLNGDLAEFSLFGGTATGQMAIAATGQETRLSLSGSAEGLMFSPEVAGLLGLEPGPNNKVAVTGRASASGATAAVLASSLEGNLELDLSGRARVTEGLVAAALGQIGEHLRTAEAGVVTGLPLTLDAFAARIRLSGGTGHIDGLRLAIGGDELKGDGSTDLAARTFDLRLWREAEANSVGERAMIGVTGPWLAPEVKQLPPHTPFAGSAP